MVAMETESSRQILNLAGRFAFFLWVPGSCGNLSGVEGAGERHNARRSQPRRRANLLAFRTHRLPGAGDSVSSESERGRLRAAPAVLMSDAGVLSLSFTVIFCLSFFHQLSFSCLHSDCCGVLRRIKNRHSHARGALPPVPSLSRPRCV